jgi:hypothetical protein
MLMTLRNSSKIVFFACLVPGFLLFGQDDTPPAIRRPSLGIRIEYFDTPFFKTSTVQASTTDPIADYTYIGSTGSPRWVLAPTVEYRLWGHLSLSGELHFHHAQYKQTTQMLSGLRDPNSSTDDRQVTTITQTTRANFWEFPFLVHYYGFRPKGWFHRAYASAGVEWRYVGKIRTGTDYSYADGTTDYNEIPAQPNLTNQFGVVVGGGLRFMDAFRVKVTPEVRYIRWQGVTFQGQGYRSMPDQLEAGIGLSF